MSFRVYKQYKFTIGAGALAAKSIPEFATLRALGVKPQIRLFAYGDNMPFKCGDNSVAASTTYTSDALPDKNGVAFNGVVEVFDIESDDTHFSAIGEVAGGTLYMTVGYNE